jgi:hypothetical protein
MAPSSLQRINGDLVLIMQAPCGPRSERSSKSSPAVTTMGDERVQLVHRHCAPHAAGLGRAGVVPVASSLPGPQRHDEHVALLKKGVAARNEWRDENPDIDPDLFEADLNGTNLRGRRTPAGRTSGARTSCVMC